MADKARRPYARLEDDEYSSTRPAKGLSRSLFRNPSRYIRAALGKESEFEKPYYDFEQRLMHLEFPDPDWPGPWSPNFPSYEPKPRHPKDPLCPRCSITIWTFNTEVCEDDPLHRDYCAHGQVCVPVSYSICHTPEDTQYFRDHGTVLPGAEQRAWDAGELYIAVGRGVALERVPEDEEPFGLLGEIKAACYRPAEGASWPEGLTEVTAVFVDMYGNNCEGYTTVYCELCSDPLCCTDPAYVAPTNDTSITPETIGASTSAIVAILDGCPPFTWSVTGTGFSLQKTKTTDRSNSLRTTSAVCGGALITVVDICGNSVSFGVRATNGKWALIVDEFCSQMAEGTHPGNCCVKCSDVTEGIYKYQDCWNGGPATCRVAEGGTNIYCTKWPQTVDQSSECCYYPGFEPCFSTTWIGVHQKWEWICE